MRVGTKNNFLKNNMILGWIIAKNTYICQIFFNFIFSLT
jgi:hypothetical protein